MGRTHVKYKYNISDIWSASEGEQEWYIWEKMLELICNNADPIVDKIR